MVKQHLPDQFYYFMFFAAAVGLLTERVWHVAIVTRFASVQDRHSSQDKRYIMAAAGLLSSGGVIGSLLIQYGLSDTITGLGDFYNMNPLLGISAWGVTAMHVLTIPLVLYFAQWSYRNPVIQYR